MYAVYNKSLGKTTVVGKGSDITARESPSSDEAKPFAAFETLGACPKASPPVVHDATGALHMCWGGEKFSQYVAAIEFPPFMFDPNGAERDTFATLVVRDGIVFLLQGGFRNSCVPNHTFVIAKPVGGPIDWDPKHAKFISQAVVHFDGDFEGDEFRPEGG